MKVEIVTLDADPDRGGFGARVHSMVNIFSAFADVRVILTDGSSGPKVPGAVYNRERVKDSPWSKFRRLRTYYKTDFPTRKTGDAPDIVIVESLDLLGMHQYGSTVPLVLDEHNVYWNLLQYEIVNSPFFRSWLGRRNLVRRFLIPSLTKRAKAFEMHALERAARTLVSSETDRRQILAELPELEGRVRVLPNCIDLKRTQRPVPARGTSDVVFIANYNYIPNKEAAMFVSSSLAPALPEARFLLVGSGAPSEAAEGGNVRATGYVRDLQPLLDSAAVCIAPLQHGSGTRLKILTYLAAAKPVVATTKACEGLLVEDEFHLLIRDTPGAFQSAIRRILEDPDFGRRLGERGRALVEAKYDWRVYVDPMKAFATELLSETEGQITP